LNLKKTEARLYLNLKAENIPLFASEALKKCCDKQIGFHFKFGLYDSRNDPFLFYTSYEKLPEFIKIIEEIKENKPELLEGTEKVSRNFGVINGYIGFGDEPDIFGCGYSFNSIREKVFSDILEDIYDKIDKKYGKEKFCLLMYDKMKEELEKNDITELRKKIYKKWIGIIEDYEANDDLLNSCYNFFKYTGYNDLFIEGERLGVEIENFENDYMELCLEKNEINKIIKSKKDKYHIGEDFCFNEETEKELYKPSHEIEDQYEW